MRKIAVLFLMVWFAFAVMVKGQSDGELLTHQYRVPPTFRFNAIANGSTYFNSDLSEIPRWPNARSVLERAGITFKEGAAAIYPPGAEALIIINTREQMELIEVYLDSLRNEPWVQTGIRIKECFLPDQSFEALLKNLDQQTLAHLPWIEQEAEQNPERGSLAGSLPAKRTQPLLKLITEDKSIKIYAQPSIVVRPGSPGVVEIAPFRYGVTTHLAQNNSQIILSLHLPPPGENLIRDPNQLNPDVKVTIWDGNTAVIRKSVEGGVALVLVTAELVDPAGILINPEGGLRGLRDRRK